MANIFLAPRSNETSYKNFESTILDGRAYTEIEPYLNKQEKEVLSKYPKVSIWGNKASLKSRWLKMVPGDYVLFYSKGSFHHSARVILTKYDEELGVKLWPVDKKNGKPWPCLFFVDNLKEVNIPIKKVQVLAKYKSSWDRVQGFMRLREKGLKSISEEFGSVEVFLGQGPKGLKEIEDILEESREEIIEDEKEEAVDNGKILEEALAYKDSGASHTLNDSPRKVRIENRQQKKRIAKLEGYACQICNWSLEWKSSKGKRAYRIDIDHIIDKADGGGEEASNLWALCPNCHVKKTLGVIKINPKVQKIEENGHEIKLHHDRHLGWGTSNPVAIDTFMNEVESESNEPQALV